MTDDQFLRIAAVKLSTGLSASTIYRRIASGSFPASRPYDEDVGQGTPVYWLGSDISTWKAKRPGGILGGTGQGYAEGNLTSAAA